MLGCSLRWTRNTLRQFIMQKCSFLYTLAIFLMDVMKIKQTHDIRKTVRAYKPQHASEIDTKLKHVTSDSERIFVCQVRIDLFLLKRNVLFFLQIRSVSWLNQATTPQLSGTQFGFTVSPQAAQNLESRGSSMVRADVL